MPGANLPGAYPGNYERSRAMHPNILVVQWADGNAQLELKEPPRRTSGLENATRDARREFSGVERLRIGRRLLNAFFTAC